MSTRAQAQTSADRPSGTVTFLFSDIEGSTVRWERDREAMSAALERHDALLRAVLEARGAYVFKTVGDAFCAAFASGPAAMTAALEAQRALCAQDFSSVQGLAVRMALHTGDADERAGDYFGPALNRVARLLAIGHGGQVLVSGTSAELLQDAMPAQSTLRDLGAHRLKDLAHPEQVYQLIAPDLREQFPPLRSLDHLSNNLPAQLSSFVGRENTLAELKTLIEQHRLVTLTGTGGAGKTRCAVQLGAEMLDGSGDGVWLVELAPLADPALVANAIAQPFNLQAQGDRPILETLTSYLKRKRLLLILDNCEHVLAQAREVASAILQSCPQVRILATSRESLNIAGEEVYRMSSLSGESAQQLFADRARSADKRFALTDENADDVAQLCARLDGLPLAIELAAARMKMLSPRQVLERLDERFRLLTAGDRGAPRRQQTMRALLDWSYELLSEPEQRLFRALSIFAGGFTLERAAALCAGEHDEFAVLELLGSLVDKSLVHAEPSGSGTRYRLLESTRQYAGEKLREQGEAQTAARAHAAVFASLAEQLDATWERTPDRAWRLQAEPELDNWRAALTWALGERGDVALGQRLAGDLWVVWSRYAFSEGRDWVRAALAAADASTPDAVLGKLDLAEADLDLGLFQFAAAQAAAKRALSRLEPLGRDAANAQRLAGIALVFLGHVAEGEALLQRTLVSAERLGLRKLKAHVVLHLASARAASRDLAGARMLYAQARALAQAVGYERGMAAAALYLAEDEFAAGNAQEALRLGEEALAALRAQNDQHTAGNALANLSAYAVALRRFDEARTYACEALRITRDLPNAVVTTWALQHLAAALMLRATERDRMRAAHLLGYADAQLDALDVQREYTELQEYEEVVPLLREALGADELARLMAQGAAWNEDQAVAEALLI